MSDSTIVFAVILGALALFIWNKIPAVIVAIGVSLALFFSGILTGAEVLAGLGDPTVILIAGLFVVGAGQTSPARALCGAHASRLPDHFAAKVQAASPRRCWQLSALG